MPTGHTGMMKLKKFMSVMYLFSYCHLFYYVSCVVLAGKMILNTKEKQLWGLSAEDIANRCCPYLMSDTLFLFI
jgi:hypothetical protein